MDALEQRFWQKVDTSGGANACWPWLLRLTDFGHGQVRIRSIFKNSIGSHRAAFYFANGWLPPVVRHRCDRPDCNNPKHLLAGTNLDNVADRVLRNRSARGEANGRSKLTARQVLRIKVLISRGVSVHTIARKFKVTARAVAYIKSGRNWAHIQLKEAINE